MKTLYVAFGWLLAHLWPPNDRKVMSAARAAASGHVCDVTDLILNRREQQKWSVGVRNG